jgi:tRNA 2-selenouridine synthase
MDFRKNPSCGEPAIGQNGAMTTEQDVCFSELDLEVQPFSSYALIIDARTPGEYDEDHVPGAKNLPVVYQEDFAKVGILHKQDTHQAYLIGIAAALQTMSGHIKDHLSSYKPNDHMLVYCFRGGKRSKLWADTLRTIGFRVDVISGGWKSYRRWVNAGLAVVSKNLEFRVLAGSTGTGKTRLLSALEAEGEQVLDLEALANHRGSTIGAIPGVPQPAQKMFDSLLFDKLRGFRSDRYVWVESESRKIGRIQLPSALHESMHQAPVFLLDAPIDERVRLWREDYGHFEQDLNGMLDKMSSVVEVVGSKLFSRWRELATEGNAPELFRSMIVDYYDRLYKSSLTKNYRHLSVATRITLHSLSSADLRTTARMMISDAHKPPVY